MRPHIIFPVLVFLLNFHMEVNAAPTETKVKSETITNVAKGLLHIDENLIGEEFSTALYGLNFIKIVGQLAETTTTLKSITRSTIYELNSILLGTSKEFQTELFHILEDAIVKAQHILSPVIKRINTILSLIPGADSLKAINMVAEIISDLSIKLSVEMRRANLELQKLAEEKISTILTISAVIGEKTVDAILTLLKQQFTKVIDTVGPLMELVP